MKIKNVLFDLDGTLLDTTEGVIESAIYAAKQLGYEELPYETMLNFVGPPIQNSFEKYYGCTKEEAQKAANLFRDYYKENALFKAVPYEGLFELLDCLKKKDINISVATYKREDYAITILQHFGIAEYCMSMHGADNNNVLSKADIVSMCMDETGGTKENTVLIGDTLHDAEGAEITGISFIGVTYGFGFKSAEDVMKHKNIGWANHPLEILNTIN